VKLRVDGAALVARGGGVGCTSKEATEERSGVGTRVAFPMEVMGERSDG
jgi:hypothetical protein